MKICHSKSRKGQSTVSQSRLGVFEPTRRRLGERKQFTISGVWGTATITGRLTQRHRDLLDVLPEATVQQAQTPDGCRHLLVDPHRLRMALGRRRGEKVPTTQAIGLLEDLTEALVEIRTTSGLVCLGHIFDEALYRAREVANEAGARLPAGTKKTVRARPERTLWRVKVAAGWTRFIAQDLAYSYDIEKVMALQHGVSAAIARLLLTHRSSPIPTGVATVLTQVGIPAGECQARWNARRRLCADRDGLRDLGISLDAKAGMLRLDGGSLPQIPHTPATNSPSAATDSPSAATDSPAP